MPSPMWVEGAGEEGQMAQHTRTSKKRALSRRAQGGKRNARADGERKEPFPTPSTHTRAIHPPIRYKSTQTHLEEARAVQVERLRGTRAARGGWGRAWFGLCRLYACPDVCLHAGMEAASHHTPRKAPRTMPASRTGLRGDHAPPLRTPTSVKPGQPHTHTHTHTHARACAGMMRGPPGCSGSHAVTSSTMPSRISHTRPAALAATTSCARVCVLEGGGGCTWGVGEERVCVVVVVGRGGGREM